MKLKKLIPLVNKTKMVYVVDDQQAGRIWLGDGSCYYPLYGITEPNEDLILTLLDIPYEKRPEYTVRIEGRLMMEIDFADAVGAEWGLRDLDIILRWRGLDARPYITQGGQAVMLQTKYFGPIDDADGSYTLYIRYKTDKTPYVVVKDGLFVKGIIAPIKNAGQIKEVLREIEAATII